MGWLEHSCCLMLFVVGIAGESMWMEGDGVEIACGLGGGHP